MKKILVAVIIVVVIGAAVLLSGKGKSVAPAVQGGPAPSKGISAEVIVVNDTTLEENISVLGTLYANEEVELASEVAGRLVRINFQEGQFVKKGQLLFKLDDSELRGRLRILEARRNFVNSSVARMEALYKAEAVSREEYENELNSLEVLDAEIDLIKVQIEKTGIIAPFDGKTGIRRISQGAYVSPNTTLVNLEDMGDVKVEFAVPEKYSSKIKSGDKITFTVENNQRTYDAVVNVVDPKIDRTTRSLFVRAKADNPDFELVPGSSASVQVALGSKTKTLIVPSQSLIPNLSGYSVFVVKNGKAVQTSVTIGIRTNSAVQVLSGLNKGDTVMTTNLLRVKEGLVINSTVAND